jgi:hypothetical protein
MGYNDYDGFEDDENDSDGSQDLHPARAAQKAAAKRNKELEAQLAKLTSQLAERTLKDVLESKGLNPALGRFIIKDGIDATDQAAVDGWLGENGSLFGFTPAANSDSAGGDGSDEGHLEHLADAQSRMQSASQGALPDDRFQQANTEIAGAKSLADIQASLNRAIKNTN